MTAWGATTSLCLCPPTCALTLHRYTPYSGKVDNLAPRDTGRLKPDLYSDELLAKRAAKVSPNPNPNPKPNPNLTLTLTLTLNLTLTLTLTLALILTRTG